LTDARPLKPKELAPLHHETREIIDRLTAECERAARAVRLMAGKTPNELRQWANRVEDAGQGESLVALSLESSARAGREFLSTETA